MNGIRLNLENARTGALVGLSSHRQSAMFSSLQHAGIRWHGLAGVHLHVMSTTGEYQPHNGDAVLRCTLAFAIKSRLRAEVACSIAQSYWAHCWAMFDTALAKICSLESKSRRVDGSTYFMFLGGPSPTTATVHVRLGNVGLALSSARRACDHPEVVALLASLIDK